MRNGVELLRSEDATRQARHASLDHVFEHSWRLLTARERAALARLSVFRGGFTPDAAKSVAGAALPVLAALADKSLLRKEGGGGREGTRGVLHPLVHQLAGRRLGDEERAATLAAHARHFHRLLAQLRPAVENGDRLALDQVQLEFENCRAAWTWAIEQRATNALAQCAPTLMNYCDHRGSIATGVALLRQALESPAAAAQPALEASLLASVAHLHFRLDQHAEAQAAATRAVEAARRLRDHAALALGLSVLGARALRGGEHAEARRWFEPALKAALAGGQRRRAAAVQHNLGLIERATGRREAARALLLESMAGYRALGDVAGEAMCLATLATLQWDAGDLPQATAHLKAALEISDRHGLDRTRMVALSNLAALAIESGDHAAARSWGRRALEIAEATGNRHFAAWMHLQFASIALQERDLALVRSELRASLEIALAMDRMPPLLEGVAIFSELLAATGEMLCARRLLRFVVEHPSMALPDSQGLRKRLDEWSAGAAALPAWPGLALDELVHRIVVETPVAHASLIALLRGAA
ncbi:MAG: tetratricopeptide repeat protein [Rubrivivax sp.]|nr:tetratricopeptide repeat protein [Rubrivivax sp.]